MVKLKKEKYEQPNNLVHAADGKLGVLNDFVHLQSLDERNFFSNGCPWSLTFTLCTHNTQPKSKSDSLVYRGIRNLLGVGTCNLYK
jgi:hypothetical protein